MKANVRPSVLVVAIPLLFLAQQVPALETEKLATHRKEVFEFTEKPAVTRAGDKVTIAFATKDACDVTVAVEDENGRIVRHLASGVLGPTAPAPFQRDTLKQNLVWDGKNDRDEYVDDKERLTIRVSLGLKPQFERTLYWSPYKLGQNGEQPSICVAPEGVYVYSAGQGRANYTQALKLFDHDGRYVRTLYPFPAADLEQVQGVKWIACPPDGKKFALKIPGESQTSLLPWPCLPNQGAIRAGDARVLLASDKDYVYLVGASSLRIAKTGSGKPSFVTGPDASIVFPESRFRSRFMPSGMALSPDGQWLYLTGYNAFYGTADEGHGWPHYLPCIMRMPSNCSRPPEPFLGKPVEKPQPDVPFTTPCDVAFDKEGRLYVADIEKGIFILAPDGKLLHTIPADTCARVQVAPDGDIWATGWQLAGAYGGPQTGKTPQSKDNTMLYHYTAFKPDAPPTLVKSFVVAPDNRAFKVHDCHAKMDFTGANPRLWFAGTPGGWGSYGSGPNWQTMNARLFEVKENKLVELLSFEAQTKKEVVQSRPPRYARQRPYVNPVDGCVYVAEQIQPTVLSDVQCFDQLVRIDPDTGKIRMVDIPFDSEDMCFDIDGNAYLRTDSIVARYSSSDWREVPCDYGEEFGSVTHYSLKPNKTVSSLYFKGGRGASGKIFGMGVNARGDIACSFYSTEVSSLEKAGEGLPDAKRPDTTVAAKGVKRWTPAIFPGRSTFAFVHIWDKHGKLKFEDAVPGLGEMSDFKIDRDDNLYMVANMNLIGYAKEYPDRFINTLVKTPAGKSKFLNDGKASTPIPLTAATKPNRPPDAYGVEGYHGNVWMEGAEWAVGGLGANPRGMSAGSCHCEANVQLALDLYGRSFVPAIHRYEVAVVDAGGNTILRIGRHGNIEDGRPLVKDGGPADPRSIGGDEVALMSAKWLAVLSDRRLFISDRGNYRLLSVRLGYHAEEKVALKNARTDGAPRAAALERVGDSHPVVEAR
jgi:hypothetical protein